MHDEGFEVAGIYAPPDGAAEKFLAEAEQRGVPTRRLQPGEPIEL